MPKALRMEVTFAADDPLSPILTGLAPGSRAKVVRAILSAALLPGGWARIVGDRVSAVTGESTPASPPPPTAQAQKATLGLLKQFGALDDD